MALVPMCAACAMRREPLDVWFSHLGVMEPVMREICIGVVGCLSLCGCAFGQAGSAQQSSGMVEELLAPVVPWSEQFDGYGFGPLTGQGAWRKWVDFELGQSSPADGTVSGAVAFSGSRSLRVDPVSDVVAMPPLVTSGKWRLTMMVYVPRGAKGTSVISVLNRYVPSTPAGRDGDWDVSARVTINAAGATANGKVMDSVSDFLLPELPVVYDQWTELRFDVDLSADRFSLFYGGMLLGAPNRPWSTNFAYRGPKGLSASRQIAAINLAGPSDGGNAGEWSIYVDDVSLVPASFTLECYANCDGSTMQPLLGPADFSCFLSRYRAGEAWANCDGSTTAPVLGAADYSCFVQRYRAGCP